MQLTQNLINLFLSLRDFKRADTYDLDTRSSSSIFKNLERRNLSNIFYSNNNFDLSEDHEALEDIDEYEYDIDIVKELETPYGMNLGYFYTKL